jgi:hypothetical protein
MEPLLLDGSIDALLTPPVDRFMVILSNASRSREDDDAAVLISTAFTVILSCCHLNPQFWDSFQQHPNAPEVIETLLLSDERKVIRITIAKLLEDRVAADQL